METLIIYFGKMILCSGVMVGYYFVFLKDKTFHHYNRFYLLSILFLSIFLPLIKIDYFTIEVNPDLFLLLKNLQTVQPNTFVQNDFNIYPFIFSAVGLVSVFFVLKFLFGLIKIQRLKKQFPKTEFEGIKFYETPLEEAPFSFFRNLFWKNSISIQSDLGRQILKHEMVHIEQKHTWDKIIMTTVNSLFWFNPIFYLIKKEIVLIHEYLADKKAVKQNDTKAFAQMLLANHFSGTSLPATSPFFSSNLKKRIIMLKKSHTKFSYLRKISALPVIFFLAFAYLVNAKNSEIKQTNEVIAKAVSVIKKDTIKSDVNSNLVEIKEDTIKTEVKSNLVEIKEDGSTSSAFPLDESLDKSSDKNIFKIKGKEVKKAEFLKFYNTNKLSKEYVYSTVDRHSKNLPKEFNLDNVSKFPGIKATNEYFESAAFKKQIEEIKLASNKDKNYINSPEFQKQIADIKRQADDASKNAENFKTEAEKVKLENQNLDKAVATENPNSITPPMSRNQWILKSDPQQTSILDDKDVKYYVDGKLVESSSWKKILPNNIKAINVVKIPGQKSGGTIYIVTKDSPLENVPTQYDRIYIDGKAATQNELFKLSKDSIKTQNIKKNTENGKSFNEITITTK